MAEFEAHTLGALRNGISVDELTAVLRQITVYCGVPAGVNAATAVRAVLERTDGGSTLGEPEPVRPYGSEGAAT
jgi:4-carboxymuconolactone decarboxylase